MKVILYMAISADGFIAKKDGDSDWVSEADFPYFEKKINEAGCIIVGRKTFDQYYDDLYPIEGVTNIVLTTNSTVPAKNHNVIFADSPRQALQIAQQKGLKKVLLIGGGHVNGAFIQENLIDELFLSVHPLILGEGIKIFESFNKQVELALVSSKLVEEGLVQLHYAISQ